MLSINTNLSSLITQSGMKQSTSKLNQAIERMTTEFKINHASDNAANYSISTNMTTKIGAYDVAEDNAAMGLDLISTAEGTLNQIQDKLERLRALAEQASNGTYGEQSLNAINAEANALVDEIERLYETAEYNGLKLFQTAPNKIANAKSRNVLIQPFTSTLSLNSSNGFVQEIIQLSEEEAIEQGYTIIKTAEELKTLTDSGKYILMNDIDLSGINWTPLSGFSGELNGNGYEILNLSIDVAENNVGLFASASGDIKNLGLSNAHITTVASDVSAGILAGVFDGKIWNCYATGSVSVPDSEDSSIVGGLVGSFSGEMNYSYFEGTIVNKGSMAEKYATGGLIGLSNGIIDSCFVQNSNFDSWYSGGVVGSASCSISNCYVDNVNFIDNASMNAGIVVSHVYMGNVTITNCYANNLTGASYAISSQMWEGEIINCSAPAGMNLVFEGSYLVITNSSDNLDPDKLPFVFNLVEPINSAYENMGNNTTSVTQILFQIGISSNWASQVAVSTAFELEGVEELRMLGLDLVADYLSKIDEMLTQVSEKQTDFGAVSNRLESVLEEITIQRDNLVSSRSTIRDADIAEVSSTYIQQQILQQASATLLATANQSPSIALQLI